MPFDVIEHVTSGGETVDLTGGDCELIYSVLDTGDPVEIAKLGSDEALAVRAAVAKKAPLEYHGLIRGVMTLAPHGAGIWSVKVRYGNLNKISLTIDTMCEKIKLMKSLKTIKNWQVWDIAALGDDGSDFDQLIGVNKDRVEGVEVYRKGHFKINLQRSTKWGSLPANYVDLCIALGGTVNLEDIIVNYKNQRIHIKKGEMVFCGAVFTEGSEEGVGVNMKFEGHKNEDDIAVGERLGIDPTDTTKNYDGSDPAPGGPWPFLSKEGMQYIWLSTRKVTRKLGGHDISIIVPDAAHIEQVYGYSLYGSALGVFDIINDDDNDFFGNTEPPAPSGGLFGDFGGFVTAPPEDE